MIAVAWYAAVGTSKALSESIPFPGAIVVGVLGGTASRWIIDVASGVRPLQLVHGVSFVGSAALVAVVYIIASEAGLTIWPATLVAVAVGTLVRISAIRRGAEMPLSRT